MEHERLIARVVRHINAERVRAERCALARNIALAVGAFAGFVVAAAAAAREMAQSGFPAYASLVISDARALSVYWSDAAWALAETFPAVRVLVSLGFALVCLRAAMCMRRERVLSLKPQNR